MILVNILFITLNWILQIIERTTQDILFKTTKVYASLSDGLELT